MTSSCPPAAPHGIAWGDIPLIAATTLAAGMILYLGRSLTFWHDEWRSITFDGGWSDYLRPVNEHWSTFPLLAYRATFHIVGLDSYLPYLAQVIALHAIAVAGTYVLVRRRMGRLTATFFAIPLLLLGSGAENLFWAFQTGFVGSVMFGVWSLVVIEQPGRWSPIVSSALLLASLMSSGIGLVFLVAAFVRTLLDPPLRRRSLAVCLPLAAYVVWYAWAGHGAVGDQGPNAPPLEIGRFVARGVAHSTAAVTGIDLFSWGEGVAGVVFLVALIAVAWAAVVHRPRPLATGSFLAIVTLYVLAGSVRAQLDFDYALVSRYVYVAGFLLALALADGLEPLQERIGPGRVLWAAFVGFACVFVTLANAGPLWTARDDFLAQADRTRAFVALAREYRGEPWVDPRSGYGVMPAVPVLVSTVEAHGSPTEDRFFPGVARRPSPVAYEEALLVLVGDRFRVGPASTRPSTPLPVKLDEIVDATVASRDGCQVISSAGPQPSATLVGPDGSRFRLSTRRHEQITAVLGFELTPGRTIVADLRAGKPVDLVVPDVRPMTTARLRIELSDSSSPLTVCPLSGAGG